MIRQHNSPKQVLFEYARHSDEWDYQDVRRMVLLYDGTPQDMANAILDVRPDLEEPVKLVLLEVTHA